MNEEERTPEKPRAPGQDGIPREGDVPDDGDGPDESAVSDAGGVPDEERIPEIVARAVEVLPEADRVDDLEVLLCGYLAHLVERNRDINLVSRKNTLTHLQRFTAECLFLARILLEERRRWKAQRAPRILDVGSGGGFPGLVLKIAIPDLEMLMVEATRKKAQFLADVSAGLDLRHTRIVWTRTEELLRAEKLAGTTEHQHRFDWVTGKALGSLRESCTMAEPFLVTGGIHWTFKGKACEEELRAASGLFRQKGLAVHRVERIQGDAESYVVGIVRRSSSSGASGSSRTATVPRSKRDRARQSDRKSGAPEKPRRKHHPGARGGSAPPATTRSTKYRPTARGSKARSK
jgi:16S rRNA (guanine527-N7)-methyltransferase